MRLNSTQAGGKTLCLVVSLLRIFFLFPTFAHISHDLMAEHLKLWLLKRGQINVMCLLITYVPSHYWIQYIIV